MKIVLKNRTEWINDNGKHHRLDGPAVEWNNGNKEWWLNGQRHRVDGPAEISDDGVLFWYLNGFYYPTREEWFNDLAGEDQIAYLFKMES